MKKIYLVALLASFCIGNAQINWKRSASGSNLPSWFTTTVGNTERGIGALNDKVYVSSRKSGNIIKEIDGTTGNDIQDVLCPAAIVTGGAIALNDVEVSTNGAILACNVTTATNTSAFKVYKWDTATATPTAIITYTNTDPNENLRLGDTFSFTGNISGNAVIFAAGRVGSTSNYKVVRWIVTGSVLGAPTVITIPALTAATGVISVTPLSISANPGFIVKASGNTMTVHNADGTLTGETIANAVVPLSSNDSRYIEVGVKKYVVSYLYNGGTPPNPTNEYAKLVDVTNGFASASTVAVTPTLGGIANGNASGGIGLKIIPDAVDGTANTITVYTLGCNNGISGTTLVKDGSTVVLGNNDFSAADVYKASKIFPNPARNEFYIAIDTDIDKDAKAFIYDIQGRQVKSAKIQENVQTITIQDLNAGEYLIKVVNGKNNTTAKLLKK